MVYGVGDDDDATDMQFTYYFDTTSLQVINHYTLKQVGKYLMKCIDLLHSWHFFWCGVVNFLYPF